MKKLQILFLSFFMLQVLMAQKAMITEEYREFKERYNLIVLTWGNDSADLCLQCDHGGDNETSFMMYARPELVITENLPKDKTVWPLGMLGKDPRTHASKEYSKSIVDFEVEKMKTVIKSELEKLH